MSSNHATNAGRAPQANRGGLDLYETPAGALLPLLAVEQLPHRIWEPAAGKGAIVKVLRDRGHAVVASDVHDWGFPLHFRRDFLTIDKAPAGTELILTNPPFNLATEFAARALELCPRVILFARVAFLESEKRVGILQGAGLERVFVFIDRIPMMHRHGWAGPKASSSVAFCWCVWRRDYEGPPTLHWLRFEREAAEDPQLLVNMSYAQVLEWADGDVRRLRMVAAARHYRPGWIRHVLRNTPSK